MTTAWPLRIYYDRSCGLCRREMHALHAHDAQARIELVDCSPPGFHDAALEAAGVTQAQAMRIIHACDAGGHWLRGVEVFEAAYGAVGLHAVSATWAHPRLRPLWDWLYPHIADNRRWLSAIGLDRPYGWLVHQAARRALARSRACADGSCPLPHGD